MGSFSKTDIMTTGPDRTAYGVPIRLWTTGMIVGIALAMVYVLSPTTIWLAVVMVPLFVLAGWRLPPEERRWVWSLLAVALALRVAMVLGLFLSVDHEQSEFVSFFFDADGEASKLRSTWIRNTWAGIPMEPYAYHGFARDYGWNSYLQVIAYLQYLLGRAPYGIHLMNVGIFLTAAVMLYRLARRSYGRLSAGLGFGVLLFFPSVFLWSTSAMKESLQYLFIAVVVFGVVEALRGGGVVRRVLAAGASLAALAALSTLKADLAILFCVSVVVGSAVAFVLRRRNLLIVCPIIAVLGVWNASQYEGIRERVADEATAVVTRAASLHIGHVHTSGHSFKLLDERFYWSFWEPNSDNSMTLEQSARFVLRGLASFVLVPLPWQSISWSEIMFVPAQMLWYCLLLLAAAGFMTALRRDALVTSLLVSCWAIPAAAISLSEGNFGTVVRHRDTVTPLIAWISAVGAAQGLAWLASLVPWPSVSDPLALSAPVRSPIPPHRAEHHIAVRSALVQASGIYRLYLFLALLVKESWLCPFAGRRTPGLDLGVPRAEEAVALRRLSVLLRGSWVFRPVPRAVAAWSEARTVDAVRRRLSEWSAPQRVRVLGWTMAFAVVSETLLMPMVGSDVSVSALGWGMRAALLVFACLFMATGQPVVSGWHEWRLQTMSRQTS